MLISRRHSGRNPDPAGQGGGFESDLAHLDAAFQEFAREPAEIAKQLGVAHILEGSVQKTSDQVRVNVQLINALTDAHLWAETYDRKLTDIFAVESEIAKTIAETLQAKLTGSEKSSMAKRPTDEPGSYELYLKGRFFWNKRTGDDLRKAIDYFNQAIAKDPKLCAGLCRPGGLVPAHLPNYGAALPGSFHRRERPRQKALELDEFVAKLMRHRDASLVIEFETPPAKK